MAPVDINDARREYGAEAAQKMLDEAIHKYRSNKQHQPDDSQLAPAFSDEALALRFADQHSDVLRYVAAWSRWMLWNGAQWREDETLKAFDLARQICRSAAGECNKKKQGAIASAKTVAAVERLARADRRLAATVEQWDSDS